MHPEMTTDDIATMRRTLLKMGGDVAARLERLLAGEEVDLKEFSVFGDPDPSWLKIDSVRHYMKFLGEARNRLDTGEFGKCTNCGEWLPRHELIAAPWVDEHSLQSGFCR